MQPFLTRAGEPLAWQMRPGWPRQAWCAAGSLVALLLTQPVAAQDGQSKLVLDAIRAIESGSERETCWRRPAAWRSIESALLPPASDPLARFEFSAGVSPLLTQSTYDCSNTFGRPVDVGGVCIFQSDPAEEFLAGTNAELRAVRALIHFEDGSGVRQINGLLATSEGHHSFEVVIPDLTDPYRTEGEEVPLSVFGCDAVAELDRELFMTACQSVIELTTLDEEFRPGLALCDSKEDVPVTPP